MELKLRRRSVYVGTVVAMFAMVGGLALASGLFPTFTSTNVYGNQGAVSSTGTIYASGITASNFITGVGGSGGTCTTPSSSGSPNVVVTAWVHGGPGACASTQDYVLQLTFTSASKTAGTYTDNFVISSEFNGTLTYTTDSVTIACVVTATGTCSAVINIDTGVATTDAQPAVDAVDLTVTGS